MSIDDPRFAGGPTLRTAPPPELLNRNAAKTSLSPALEVAVSVLQEAVNYALCRFKECAPMASESDYHLAILLPFRHLIDLVDGVQVLVAEVSAANARLQLRAAFETVMTLSYITAEDSIRRSYAYLVGNALTQIGNLRRLQRAATLPGPAQVLEGPIANIIGALARPGWREAHEAFTATKQHVEKYRGRRMPQNWWPHWYSLYGGPKDLFGLAECLKAPHPYEYDLLYRHWSEATHGTDVTWQWQFVGEHGLRFRPLRSAQHFSPSVTFAVDFLLRGMKAVLTHYGLRQQVSDVDRWSGACLHPALKYLGEHLPETP